jgi:hypothetical protein
MEMLHSQVIKTFPFKFGGENLRGFRGQKMEFFVSDSLLKFPYGLVLAKRHILWIIIGY